MAIAVLVSFKAAPQSDITESPCVSFLANLNNRKGELCSAALEFMISESTPGCKGVEPLAVVCYLRLSKGTSTSSVRFFKHAYWSREQSTAVVF